MEHLLGSDHPDVLTSRNNLAYAYAAAGRLDEAIALFKGTVVDLEGVLGADDPLTLTCRTNLAPASTRQPDGTTRLHC